MSFEATYESLILKGFYVFPLIENGKTPAVSHWPEFATNRGGVWTPPDGSNIGIFTGRFESGALIVVDIDNKGEKCGDSTVLDLALEGCEFPDTYTVITPNGGRHLYYFSDTPVRSGVDVLGSGIDIRSAGGFVVGEGSRIDGVEYRGNAGSIRAVPAWVIERCAKPRTKRKAEKNEKIEGINEENAIKRAIHYLENEAPQAIEGASGDQTTFRVAATVKDFGVSLNRAADLLANHWNERNSPPWSGQELLQKTENAYRYGENPVGSASPEAVFSKVEVLPHSTDESYLETINREHALIYVEGSHFVLFETVDERGAPRRVYLTEAAFKRKYSPFLVEQGGRQRPKTQAELWLDWKGRREYAGVCFAPLRDPGHNYYNLWRGWTVAPVAPENATPEALEGFRLFQEHSLENVCGGDQELNLWLTGYFAHLIQKPFERPLSTLVFKGKKGTGKNALIDRVGNLLGRGHYLVAHNGRYLTSNFNGHMDSCLCLVLDEAFWSGDKSAEGQLKGLSTAPTILIERKGKEPYTVDNLVRLVVIGNEDWLVPASNDERRYAVFEMGTGRMQDTKYFERMRILMDDKGGASVLLHFLQNFDLSKVDVNVAPKTEALLDQKISSLDVFHEWWLACLSRGEIVGLEFEEGWPEYLSKDSVRRTFLKYKSDRNSKGWAHSENAIGRMLTRCAPTLGRDHKSREGERWVNSYKIPPLKECRDSWEKFIGHKTKWDQEEEQ